MSLEYTNQTKIRIPISKKFFLLIKNSILGSNYNLSLVFTNDKEAKKINLSYRKGNYVPNVLSFPLEKNTGEVFISPSQAKKESPLFEMNYKKFLIYLFIHGCLHLKGHDHGEKMEKLEEKFLRKFS